MGNHRDNIQMFRRVGGEPFYQTWLRFRKLLLQCPIHIVPNNFPLQYFYHTLGSVNKGLINKLIEDGMIRQSCDVAILLPDDVIKVNRA